MRPAAQTSRPRWDHEKESPDELAIGNITADSDAARDGQRRLAEARAAIAADPQLAASIEIPKLPPARERLSPKERRAIRRQMTLAYALRPRSVGEPHG